MKCVWQKLTHPTILLNKLCNSYINIILSNYKKILSNSFGNKGLSNTFQPLNTIAFLYT